MLSKTKPVVRSADIAEGFIYLTESGREIAEMIYERHELLTDWLVRLGVEKEIAADDACRIEHVISKKSFNAIKRYVQNPS